MIISRAQVESLSRSRVILKLTAAQVLICDWIAGSSQVITLGEEGVRAKAKFRRKLNPGALLTFLPTYSVHNRLSESP